jgi:lysophospholipid acyltransferase (LPLAT)-like uncharacterized protein
MIESLIKSFLWFSEPFLIALLVRILGFSWRIEFQGVSLLKRYNFKVLYVFWHEYYLPAVYSNMGTGVGVLVSSSRDGELSGRVLKLLGYKPFKVKKGEREIKAMVDLINYGKKGNHIAVTPDGPVGPRRKAKKGVLHIAKRSRLPIFAVSIEAHPHFRFSSWDKLMLPLPFAKIQISVKGPIKNPTIETLEKHLS